MFSLDIDTKGMHEGALINVAWWLWEAEEAIKSQTDFQDIVAQTRDDLILYGTSILKVSECDGVHSVVPVRLPPGDDVIELDISDAREQGTK